jgi:hypothetical protein
MTEVPKIVRERLRAAGLQGSLPGQGVPGQSVAGQTVSGQTAPPTAHPDADLLAAFAEQALSATVRAGVLEHLAYCGECREVVVLALPNADMVPVPTAANPEADAPALPGKSRWNWLRSASLARPGLRWAALAAGVALAGSVLLLHPGKLNQATLPSINEQHAPATLPAAGPQIASSTVESSPGQSSPVVLPPVHPLTTLAKVGEAPAKPELQMSKKLAGPAASQRPESGMMLAENNPGSGAGKTLPAPSPASPSEPAGSSSQTLTDTVEVAAAAEVTAPSSEDTLMARKPAPAIEKAKPGPEPDGIGQQQDPAYAGGDPAGLQSQTRNVIAAAKLAPSVSHASSSQTLANRALANSVTWTIKAGVLQRSFDGGQTWQNALPTDHPLLCYASHNRDLWTGGQAGTLFHSSDNGLTWVQVQPSVKAHALSSDVTRIEIHDNLRSPAEIVVSTNDNEIWSSTDGGKSWDKK